MHNCRNLFIFFFNLTLTIFFFSTEKVRAKSFEINNIEISKPFKKDLKNKKKKNIFPTQIIKKTFLFIPIIIDQADQDIIVF